MNICSTDLNCNILTAELSQAVVRKERPEYLICKVVELADHEKYILVEEKTSEDGDGE